MSLDNALTLLVNRGYKTSVYNPDQWPTPAGQTIAMYDGSFSDYLSIYKTQPSVRQVVAFIAENVASVPLLVRQKVSDEERETLPDHPVTKLLKWPNPEYSQYEFLRDMVTDLEIFDCTFWRRYKVGSQEYLVRMYPDAVEIKTQDAIGPKVFTYRQADGTSTDLDRANVLYLHGYGNARGISPMETLKRILQEDQAAGSYREGMYRNGMRNAGVIERPLDAPDWSSTARERFLGQLADRHNSNAGLGRPLLLEEGMAWKSDQISTRSEEYVASREFSTRAVANAYRIAPTILGLTDAPYASITAYNQQLYQNALASRLTFITQGIERQLLAPDEYRDEQIYIEFNLSAKLRGSFAERAAIGQMAVGSPWMTVDEWRALEDLPPLTDEQQEQLSPSMPAPGPDPTAAGEVDQPAPSQDNPKHSRKALERGAVSRREKYVQKLYDVLEPTMERATSSAKHGGIARLKADRWASEISRDLEPVMREIVVAEGTRKFADFDPDYIKNYVKQGARYIGAGMARKIAEAGERHEGNSEAMLTALTATAAQFAQGQASHLMSFAREEAGKQGGKRYKTWNVTSANSRHPELDGERVKLGETFSNGLAYPGDPSGDADQNANCQCILDIT